MAVSFSKKMISDVFNTDCISYMRTIPDNFFDLAIADPPYGIGVNIHTAVSDGKRHGNALTKRSFFETKDWDSKAPDNAFFDELMRVSKNQIIWGANHFISRIPYDSSCWIVWDKDNGDNDFADCELAWISLPCAVRRFRYKWSGMLQENMANKEKRIHPTQKPVGLYAWLLNKFAKAGDRIFDPMMGSQSSRIAAHKLGFDYTGCELDKDYFASGCKRYEKECLGITEMTNGNRYQQMSLF